ncbi:RRP5 [Brettanomyces bruxellensis]|uniref:mRNA 3'-end-processing protein RNA14 n=1 Tax=Dekkera bruxellensis TaxID=5007 RepID=A0A7D9CY68_DEKBR|nr:RRP5 [Brettanomyces bruxellensis]
MVEKRKRSSVDDDAEQDQPPVKSILKQSAEIAFPRGGESVLTPLEIKKISNQAKSDVLFEQAHKESRKSKKHGGKSHPKTVDEEEQEKSQKVEELSFKILQPGSYVLGKVAKVTNIELTLSLADNLQGYVPITNVSKELSKQLDAYEEQEGSEDEDDDEDMSSDDDEGEAEDNGDEQDRITIASKAKSSSSSAKFPNLSTRFSVGQYLRAYVVENTSDTGKKRFELSIEPENVNKGLKKDDFEPNTYVQASIRSVEDHGAILDLGMHDMNGFLSKKDATKGGIDLASLEVGSVHLLAVKKRSGRTLQLTIPSDNVEKEQIPSSVSTIDAILPGSLVDCTITDVVSEGLIVKAFGLANGSISLTHIGKYNSSELEDTFKVGESVRARVYASYIQDGLRNVQLSLLPHIVNLKKLAYDPKDESAPLVAFPIGHIFDEVTISGCDSNYLFADLGSRTAVGQIHKSRVSKGADLDADFKTGSTHRARVLGYSLFDNVYILTMDEEKIDQKYLRMEDIPAGQYVKCKVDKIVPGKGIQVNLEDTFEGFVPDVHISDVHLLYPQRKFKIGRTVKGRVLRVSINSTRPTIYITLKRTLVSADDSEIISSFDEATVGKRALATVERFYPGGCLVSFFGFLRGFLPNSEISETFVSKPQDFLKLGQTVRVRIINVEKEKNRMKVSMRVAETLSEKQTEAMEKIVPGKTIVECNIVEKNRNSLIAELADSNLRGVIPCGQLSDKTYDECRSLLKKTKVGSTVKALVISKVPNGRFVDLTLKPSLMKDAANGVLPSDYSDITMSSKELHGFVKNVTRYGVFVSFANQLTGLILPRYLNSNDVEYLEKKFFVNQSISCRVVKMDDANKRFLLSMKESKGGVIQPASNPVDKHIKKLNEYIPGRITRAVVKSVKLAYLIVRLADNQLGRIDVTNLFDKFEDIKDPKNPTSQFKEGEILKVKVIGYFDSRNHTYLTENHRRFDESVIGLSARKVDIDTGKNTERLDLPTIEDAKIGDEILGFVNNFSIGAVWISMAAKYKGRVSFMNLSSDISVLSDVEKVHPIGSALKLKIVDVSKQYSTVELSGRADYITSIDSVHVGDRVPARVVKVYESYVLLELGDHVDAAAYITEALDDYDQKLEEVYAQNDVVAARVLEVDKPSKRIEVSLQSDTAKDKSIDSVDDLKVGDIVRGFVNRINNGGLLVTLSKDVYAFVKVANLSDSYLKDWKPFFKLYQPVTGKVVRADGLGKIMLSLKESDISGKAHLLKRFEDLKVGEIYDGVVRSVVEYGVFVKLDGCLNLTGLCYHTEIADHPVKDIKSIFGEGDKVKVKILKLNAEKQHLSLGMKASYFANEENSQAEKENTEGDAEEIGGGEDEIMSDASESEKEEDFVDATYANDNSSDDEDAPALETETASGLSTSEGLSTGIDWTASVLEQAKDEDESDSDDEYDENLKKKKKRSKRTKISQIEDKTAEINTRAPESVSDFERLLLGNPNSSIMWIQYMSFQLQLGEIEKARKIGDRALKTINYREESEKMNVWIALLNLENMFGTEDTLKDTFTRACQYMDAYTMHRKLASIYISSDKFEEADSMFKVICKKFGYDHVIVWVAYGRFLIERSKPDEAHQVLAKALQVLTKRSHVEVVRKFAQLEFSEGDPEQGRSLFEGLLSDVPKRLDIWNVYIDQEIKNGDKNKVEDLFERVSARKLTKKQAKFFFGKWLSYEGKNGDEKASDYVKAKAAEYAQQLAEKN